jgi:hypothetical protein
MAWMMHVYRMDPLKQRRWLGSVELSQCSSDELVSYRFILTFGTPLPASYPWLDRSSSSFESRYAAISGPSRSLRSCSRSPKLGAEDVGTGDGHLLKNAICRRWRQINNGQFAGAPVWTPSYIRHNKGSKAKLGLHYWRELQR